MTKHGLRSLMIFGAFLSQLATASPMGKEEFFQRVDRFDPTRLRLEINPGISRADAENKALARTVLERN
jgi:hypothetical protein